MEQYIFTDNIELARAGNVDAQVKIGEYFLCSGVQQNCTEAIKWFLKAAKQNNPDALHYLSECYEEGIGVEKDAEKADFCTFQAAHLGHPAAQFKVGIGYVTGENYSSALEWFKKSAEQGYVYAFTSLATMYIYGYGVSVNYEKAIEYLVQAAGEDLQASYLLGNLYYYGHGVSQDTDKALEHYAEILKSGYDEETTEDIMFKILKIGHTSNPVIQYYLAQDKLKNNNQYLNFLESSKEKQEYIELLIQSAEGGFSKAQYELGKMYEVGLGVEKDMDKAIKWLRKAAEQGDEGARYSLNYLCNPNFFK